MYTTHSVTVYKLTEHTTHNTYSITSMPIPNAMYMLVCLSPWPFDQTYHSLPVVCYFVAIKRTVASVPHVYHKMILCINPLLAVQMVQNFKLFLKAMN